MATIQVFNPQSSQHGKSYQGLANANPYANVEYRKSWLQRLLTGLGFRTNYDAYLESMALQAKEYDNALMQKEYDETYNSPLAQAQRERQAGLNPDLTGNLSSGDASPIKDDVNPPIAPESDGSAVSTFASTVISGLQAAFGMASGYVSLAGQIIDNRSKRINQIGQEDSMMYNALLNILPSNDEEEIDYNSLYNKFKATYGSRIKKKYFADFVGRAFNFQKGLGFKDKQLQILDDFSGKRKNYYRTTSGQDYSDENEVMKAVSGELSDLALEVSRISMDHEKLKKGNDILYEENIRPEEMANKLAYVQTINPAKMAKNEMSKSDLETGLLSNQKWLSDYNKKLNSSYKRILDKLDRLEEGGNWFAPYAKLFISAFLLGNVPGLK